MEAIAGAASGKIGVAATSVAIGISDAVADTITGLGGQKILEQIRAGVGIPDVMECLICRKAIRTKQQPFNISIIPPIGGAIIPLCTHAGCGESRIVPPEELDQITQCPSAEEIESGSAHIVTNDGVKIIRMEEDENE